MTAPEVRQQTQEQEQPQEQVHMSPEAEWSAWLEGPAGQYVLGWEQQLADERVGDLFGFNAFQCGMPELDALRANRMPLRRLVLNAMQSGLAGAMVDDLTHLANVVVDTPDDASSGTRSERPVLTDQFEALPFASQSLDLLVLPHVLESSVDPHQLLREVERVLRPEGRVIIFGLNPFSLWGARHLITGWFFKPKLPQGLRMIPLSRLRDWLKLLEIEFDRASFGCYRPLVSHETSLRRTRFFEALGDRFWPVCGAVYCVTAVKRVTGMRLIGPAWKGKMVRHKVGQVQGVRKSRSGAVNAQASQEKRIND